MFKTPRTTRRSRAIRSLGSWTSPWQRPPHQRISLSPKSSIHSYADGGLFANSPDSLAVHEAERFTDVEPENVHVMSIGTTTSWRVSSDSLTPPDGGRIYGWAKDQRLVQRHPRFPAEGSDYMLGHRLGSRYLRLDTEQSPDRRNTSLWTSRPRARSGRSGDWRQPQFELTSTTLCCVLSSSIALRTALSGKNHVAGQFVEVVMQPHFRRPSQYA